MQLDIDYERIRRSSVRSRRRSRRARSAESAAQAGGRPTSRKSIGQPVTPACSTRSCSIRPPNSIDVQRAELEQGERCRRTAEELRRRPRSTARLVAVDGGVSAGRTQIVIDRDQPPHHRDRARPCPMRGCAESTVRSRSAQSAAARPAGTMAIVPPLGALADDPRSPKMSIRSIPRRSEAVMLSAWEAQALEHRGAGAFRDLPAAGCRADEAERSAERRAMAVPRQQLRAPARSR